MAWVEALQVVKDMFPRMSNSELMAPVDNIAVSTERLRQRCLQEGMSDAAIQEIEEITRNEFASLQNQLMLLRQKYYLLMDTLRQLEVHIKIFQFLQINLMIFINFFKEFCNLILPRLCMGSLAAELFLIFLS